MLGGIGLFAGGVLFGTAGVAVLKSEDAKKAYVQIVAAALRCKDEAVKVGTAFKESFDDICADAGDINEKRYAAADLKKIEEARALIAEYEASQAKE